ncbi:kinase-like superfamily [Micractinium conductrix]|uniref:Kinase-like superfamily n=1 Tax=Micractinium conductrix TaxID=554055 RepID=A0A2P6VPY6_9CHLO|nr:kinase-like superfamily [Micractinium conductrix]|eukprot:PSC76125.1 kinase-like superfamily [Micractinium conductrix]
MAEGGCVSPGVTLETALSGAPSDEGSSFQEAVSSGTTSSFETADDPAAVAAIVLPRRYRVADGGELLRGLRLGKFLGAGMQAKVYRLEVEGGKPSGRVIKINHGDLGSKILNNNWVWVGMDREWTVGSQLRLALQVPETGALPGFMAVHDCVLRREGSCSPGSGPGGCSAPPASARFAGMVMGELRGWEIYKRIETPHFHNISYIKTMLYQVFSALDRAQRALGFHHADLGMRNILEHYPTLWSEVEGGEAAAAALPRRPGFTCNADGSRLPLGPEVEFKIIDYGLAKLSDKLAAAAGGRAGRQQQAAVQEMMQSLKLNCRRSGAQLEIEARKAGVARRCTWLAGLCGCNPAAHKFTTKAPPLKDKALRVLRTLSMGRRGGGGGGGGAVADVERGEQERPHRFATVPQLPDASCDRGGRQYRRKTKSPIETLYRHFWHRKGDVFHLLLNLALALDARVWPAQDEETVEDLISLVHHVTGIRMSASYADVGEGEARNLLGALVCMHRPHVIGGDDDDAPTLDARTRYGRRARASLWLKRWYFRIKAHCLPYNSGLRAAEALVHPFFGAGGVQHAPLPAPLAAMGLDQMLALGEAGEAGKAAV